MNQYIAKLSTYWQRYQLARFEQRYTYRQFYMVLVSILVGLLGGLTTILLHELINLSSDFFFEGLQPLLVNIGLGRYALVALPAIGGVLVGFLAWKLIDPHSPHGVAAIMERVALFSGRLHAKPILTRLGGAIITLGSGGSAGPEDPSVQIGSLMGSTVADRLRLSSEQTRTLVGCGAAAGIASAFNAPLAGAFFAMEIILGQFQGMAFAMIVISAVTSAVTTEMILGRGAAFSVPAYTFVSFQELLLYLILGALAGLVAILYVRSLAGFADHFHGWDIPVPLKAGFGGLMVGGMGLFLPQIMGQSYNPLQSVLNGQQLAVGLLAALVLGKIVATSITLGSGGMGGVFAPSLFIGAMLGSLFGQIAHQNFPVHTGPAAAYAMVGMAAVLAATIHSPLTAIMLLFEMTNNFRILLPVTIAVVTSTLVVDILRQDSVYIGALLRRGIQLDRSHDVDVMQAVRVSEVMDTHPPTVPPDMPLLELQNVFAESRHHGLPVTDANKQLLGIVTVQDLVRAIEHSGQWEQRTVADIATKNPVTAYPDEPMWLALKRMAGRDIGRLPVVSRTNPGRLVGILRRANVVHAYSLAIRRRTEMQEWSDQFRLARLTGKEPLELKIVPGAFADGCRVQDLPLPEDCLLTAARHHRKFQ
ncbi:MAG: CBS domain-containing protein [Chloroflexi bacterium]|nr:MAG: CBS domain-containing protein [Chloroflexota bacterium]